MNFEQLKNSFVSAAEKMGVEQYEIYYQQEESISAETLKDEISAFASGVSGGICFRCIVNGKMGYAAGECLDSDAAEDMVRRAVSNAQIIDNDDEVILYAGSEKYAKTEQFSPELSDAETVRKNALKLQEELYRRSEKVSDGTQTAAMSVTSKIYLYNSHGLELYNHVGMSGAYANAVVRDGEEAQQSFEFAVGKKYEDLAHLPETAVKSALERLHATTVPSGKYDVLFSGRQFRAFLSAFSSVFSAKNAQLGLSLLAGKEGEQVASPCVTLTDDPMRAGCPMQTCFDGEGVATYRKSVIEKGVLKTLLYDLTSAKKAGKVSTGNGQRGGYASPVSIVPFSFGIEAGENSREELLMSVGEGIFITECKGFHAGANAVTGDFSIESEGFRIRNGKIAEPIKSFTVSGNFFDLLKRVDTLGDTVDWGIPSSFCIFGSPDVLVRSMPVAGA